MFEILTTRAAFHILTGLPSLGRIRLKGFFEAGAKHRGAPKETALKILNYMVYVTPSYQRAREWRDEMETKAAAKFAPLLVRRAAEGLDVMRREGI